ncbi:hypothetical protein [Paraburkholderia tropica]|uniref:hypothetical protein n=1 Tax=Paraburkholderia tropica TaxID=92647 RepID=UPI002ABE0FA0|nr:hypothetical protein [Paraburkholderia tropica]
MTLSDLSDLDRDAPKPGDRATEIMVELQELWLAMSPGQSEEDFEREVHDLFDLRDVDVKEIEAEYQNVSHLSKRELGGWPLIEMPIAIAYGYAYSAHLGSLANLPSYAWSKVELATFWWGLAMGLARPACDGEESPTISEIARRAAHARNAENRALKEEAIQWLSSHRGECKSKDDAAERLTQIVPVAFRTARRYVAEFDLSRH